MGEFAESARAEVAQLMLLQMPPDVFGRVKLGRVGWEVLELDRSFEALDVEKLTGCAPSIAPGKSPGGATRPIAYLIGIANRPITAN